MSIWIDVNGKKELAPHAYERTLIGLTHFEDKLVIWVEGSNFDFKFKKEQRFQIAGGNIETTAGFMFTKEDLLEIANNMKEGALFKVAACNSLNREGVIKDFQKSNNMEKVSSNGFSPKK